MNSLTTVTSGELDLLAEGELSAEERADLYRRLDAHPTQWKQCALAVLETQAVRNALTHSFQATTAPAPASASMSHETTCDIAGPVTWSRRPVAVWQCAMTVLAAIAILVSGALGYRLGSQAQLNSSVARSQTADATGKPRAMDAALRAEVAQVLDRLRLQDEQLLGMVRVKERSNAHLVPIVASPTLAARLLASPLPPLPPRQIRLANQRGWNVLQQRKLLAIARPDSELEVVPLQLVQYQFVGPEAL